MATRRTSAELDVTQEDTSRRPPYPAALTTTSNPFISQERHPQQSAATSRSARTLPLPSPTWFSPTKTYPPPQALPGWERQGPQTAQQQSPQQFFIGTPHGNPPRPLQGDYASLVKQDRCSPTSFVDSDEATQVAVGEPAGPETERQRLKAEIERLQAQIEDLHRNMDLFKRHAARKDAQYLQIIEQSKRREVQGAVDNQKWREDRKQWADERQLLQETIVGLNTKLGELHTYYSRGKTSEISAQASDHSLAASQHSMAPATTSSQQSIQQSTVKAAHRPPPSGTQTPLEQLQYESGQLAEYSVKLVDIGKNIQLQLDRLKDSDAP